MFLRIPDDAETGEYTVRTELFFDDGDKKDVKETVISVLGEESAAVADNQKPKAEDKTIITVAADKQSAVKGGAEAAKQKHPVVMSPSSHNYLDYYQGEGTAEGAVYAGLRMKKTYGFEPVPEGVEEKYILGNQGNLWSEQLQNIRNVEYMAWPRLKQARTGTDLQIKLKVILRS